MNVLTASNLAKSYPLKDIFSSVSFRIEKGDKAGLIGANGAGKTTLFNILTGEISPDSGEIYIANDTKVGYLKQILSLDTDMTIYEFVLGAFKNLLAIEREMRELERQMAIEEDPDRLDTIMKAYTEKSENFADNNGYAIKSEIEGTLTAMGFARDEFDKNISELSGGQKARVELSHLILEKPVELRDSMHLKFTPRIQSGVDVLRVKDLAKSYGEEEIFSNISFDLYRKERCAIIGENGVGKTTLFRIIMGEENKNGGDLRIGQSVNIGYFDQEQKSLDLTNTIFEEISKTYPMLTNYEIRSYLAKFMFYEDDIDRTIGELSGGERARISLLKLMISDTNFILMDEPTNHLDIDSKEILEDAILDYEGTVLIISHDRYFLNKIAVKILDMKNDGMVEYLGNYSYYEKKLREMSLEDEKKETLTKTQIKKQRQKENIKKSELRKIKNDIRDIERRLEEIDEEIKSLTDLTMAEGFYDDNDKVAETFSRIKSLEEEKENLDHTWLELSLKIE